MNRNQRHVSRKCFTAGVSAYFWKCSPEQAHDLPMIIQHRAASRCRGEKPRNAKPLAPTFVRLLTHNLSVRDHARAVGLRVEPVAVISYGHGFVAGPSQFSAFSRSDV